MSLDTDRLLRRQQRIALFAIFGLGGSATAWAMLVPLDGAVTASGQVTVETNVKKVQHPTGGLIGKLNVREGQRVEAGEVVARLDETQVRAQLGVIVNDLNTARARQSRLTAERDGQLRFTFPAELVEKAKADPEVRAILDSEMRFFHSRTTARNGQKAQLSERIGQLRNEVQGLEVQRVSAIDQLRIARADLNIQMELKKKELSRADRISSLEREIALKDGQIGQTVSQIAQSRGKITETEVQIGQIDREMIADVAKDLRETASKISESIERKVAAEDQLKKVDILAPIAGIVHQLSVHTVGGVINQGEQMMLIMPDGDQLVIEARVNPQDRDQLTINQSARIRFPSFNARTTPEIRGTVFRMPADVVREPQSGQSYYTVGVRLVPGELEKLGGVTLAAGMPAEVFIKTTDRTLMSFLVKPLSDHLAWMFTGK